MRKVLLVLMMVMIMFILGGCKDEKKDDDAKSIPIVTEEKAVKIVNNIAGQIGYIHSDMGGSPKRTDIPSNQVTTYSGISEDTYTYGSGSEIYFKVTYEAEYVHDENFLLISDYQKYDGIYKFKNYRHYLDSDIYNGNVSAILINSNGTSEHTIRTTGFTINGESYNIDVLMSVSKKNIGKIKVTMTGIVNGLKIDYSHEEEVSAGI